MKHRVFISYHHDNDQPYKDYLCELNTRHDIFIDCSVDTSTISENLSDELIRQNIRDNYLRNSTVTILLVGAQTRYRKHVDWELFSSMIDGKMNKKSGILVINLPTANSIHCNAPHGDEEKKIVYPEYEYWTSISTRNEYELRYPKMPPRITDNLISKNTYISVVPWEKACKSTNLEFLIDCANRNKQNCVYDLSRGMRRQNALLEFQIA